jgi:nucleoside phosphorylase
MPVIGLIVAMRAEAGPLLKLVGARAGNRLGGRPSWRFQAGAHDCVMILSGMGREPARKAAEILAETESPRLIVSFGIAGALGKGFAIGDVVEGECCRAWEDGRLGNALPLSPLSEAARQAVSAAAGARGARYSRGTVLTVRGLQKVTASVEGPAVLEMETVPIAQAAAARGIPLVSLRSISDSPEQPIPFAMHGDEEFHLRPLVLLGAILRGPSIIRALLRLRRNGHQAARNLAEAVFAALRC